MEINEIPKELVWLEDIMNLVKNNPNDMELGGKVRHYMNENFNR